MARSSLYPASVQPGKPHLSPPPPGWQTVRLGELVEIIERPAELQDDHLYQLVTARRSRGGIVARNQSAGKDILTKTQFFVEEGDFLISNRQIIHGGCGLVPPSLEGAIVSNEYTVLRTTSRVLPEFLQYLSHTTYLQQTFFQASVGVDVEKMVFDCDQWLAYKINVPPLAEQRRIIEVLDAAGDIIQATQAVINQTRKVKKGLMKSLLTKGINHTRFKQTETEGLPEGWVARRLEEVCSLSGGAGFPIKYQGHQDLSYPFIKVSDMNLPGNEKFIEAWNNTIDETIAKAIRARPFPKGSIIFPKVGAALLTNKRRILKRPTFVDNNIMVAVPHDELNTEYLYHYLCEIDFSRHVQPGAVPSINQAMVGSIIIPLPPRVEQDAIVDVLSAIDQTSAHLSQELTQYEALKTGLMSDLLTGRKRATTDLPMAAE
jgi:type I restriction enzyme S subunit